MVQRNQEMNLTTRYPYLNGYVETAEVSFFLILLRNSILITFFKEK